MLEVNEFEYLPNISRISPEYIPNISILCVVLLDVDTPPLSHLLTQAVDSKHPTPAGPGEDIRRNGIAGTSSRNSGDTLTLVILNKKDRIDT